MIRSILTATAAAALLTGSVHAQLRSVDQVIYGMD